MVKMGWKTMQFPVDMVPFLGGTFVNLWGVYTNELLIYFHARQWIRIWDDTGSRACWKVPLDRRRRIKVDDSVNGLPLQISEYLIHLLLFYSGLHFSRWQQAWNLVPFREEPLPNKDIPRMVIVWGTSSPERTLSSSSWDHTQSSWKLLGNVWAAGSFL